MATAECPKCGARLVETGTRLTLEGEEKCIDLKGTKYLDPMMPGIQWCPSLSDAAPEDWMLLPSGHRQQVLDDIARTKLTSHQQQRGNQET